MGLETVDYVADLVVTNPTASDPKSQGDDHIRNLKEAMLQSFTGFPGAILVTGTDGGSANTYTLTPTTALPSYGTKMIAVFAPNATNTGAATLNISGLGAKNIKDVIGNALTSGDLVSGSIYAAFYNGTEFRLLSITKNYIDQLAFGTAFPSQTGNADKVPTTDGTNVSWTALLKASTIRFADSTDTTKRLAFDVSGVAAGQTRTVTIPDASTTLVGTDTTQTLTNKSLSDSTTYFVDNVDSTKKVQFQLSGITAGQTRTITFPDSDLTLGASGLVPLSTVTASASATVDIETTFDSTYDEYIIIATNVISSTADRINCRLKIGGSYITTATYGYHTNISSDSATTYSALAGASGAATSITITDNNNGYANFVMRVHAPASATILKQVDWDGCQYHTASARHTRGVGLNTGTSALTGVRFFGATGNITGTFRLYGIKKS